MERWFQQFYMIHNASSQVRFLSINHCVYLKWFVDCDSSMVRAMDEFISIANNGCPKTQGLYSSLYSIYRLKTFCICLEDVRMPRSALMTKNHVLIVRIYLVSPIVAGHKPPSPPPFILC